jgi:hypothetical protein
MRVKTLLFGAAALLIALAGMAGSAAAQGTSASGGALIIHTLVCPVGYTGMDYLGNCAPESGIGIHVSLDGSEFAAADQTGADGAATVSGLGAGTYTIGIDVPGDFARFVTYCSAPGEIEPRQLTNRDTNQIGVDLAGTDELTCSFYIIPDNAAGAPQTLPTTGIHATPSTDGGAWLPLAALASILALAGFALSRRAAR